MYNDFVGEVLSEEIRTGQKRQPNKKNLVSSLRAKNEKMIEDAARESGEDAANVSLALLESRLPDVQRYVAAKGEQPQTDPVSLCVQAHRLRVADEKQIADALDVPFNEARYFIDEAESRAKEVNSSDADNFIGDIVSAVGNVANKAIEKAKAKRAAKGKKTGLLNTLGDVTGALAGGGDPNIDAGAQQGGGGLKKGIAVLGNEVLDAIKKNETKKQINKILPIAIVGVVILIIVTVLITRNAKH